MGQARNEIDDSFALGTRGFPSVKLSSISSLTRSVPQDGRERKRCERDEREMKERREGDEKQRSEKNEKEIRER